MMIANGLIPYLAHKYGEEAFQFFDPEAVVAKSEWKWDEENSTIINPLLRELEGLDKMDKDLDFSIVMEDTPVVEEAKESGDKEGEEISAAQALAANRLNMVLIGNDDDSVSTMGN